MRFFLKNNKGFSLLEMILVVAIFVIILSSVVGLLGDKTVREDLSAKAQEVVNIISRAHDYAVNSYYGDNWGVKILDASTDCYTDGSSGDCLIIFKGKSYDSRSSDYDEKVLLDTSVFIDSDQTNEFYFQRISGWLSTTTGALAEQAIILQTNLGSQKIVTTTPTGLVYYGD
ncbi:type II secretion system protein [Candidatus Nomurabacteria bacterium]|nr:type II secretion system protein [Candidatus Nomurabacteria bacterium]